MCCPPTSPTTRSLSSFSSAILQQLPPFVLHKPLSPFVLSSDVMAKARTFAALAAFVQLVAGAIGPIADLTISDADVSPDGFTRAAVVMNGQFPGPLITGNKVCSMLPSFVMRNTYGSRRAITSS